MTGGRWLALALLVAVLPASGAAARDDIGSACPTA